MRAAEKDCSFTSWCSDHAVYLPEIMDDCDCEGKKTNENKAKWVFSGGDCVLLLFFWEC